MHAEKIVSHSNFVDEQNRKGFGSYSIANIHKSVFHAFANQRLLNVGFGCSLTHSQQVSTASITQLEIVQGPASMVPVAPPTQSTRQQILWQNPTATASVVLCTVGLFKSATALPTQSPIYYHLVQPDSTTNPFRVFVRAAVQMQRDNTNTLIILQLVSLLSILFSITKDPTTEVMCSVTAFIASDYTKYRSIVGCPGLIFYVGSSLAQLMFVNFQVIQVIEGLRHTASCERGHSLLLVKPTLPQSFFTCQTL